MKDKGLMFLLYLMCFLFFFCVCMALHDYFTCRNVKENSSDTLVVILRTDSCHFYLDSANFVIDEKKIEYVK